MSGTKLDHCRTIFTCRTCDVYTHGNTDGTTDAAGWKRIARIDGPHHICPKCAVDPTSLDLLREEYNDAHIVEASNG